MTSLKIKSYVNGQLFTSEQLSWIAYQRCLHSLHQMKHLGAAIKFNERELNHADIDLLKPQSAKQISIDIRKKLGISGLLKLFHHELSVSDKLWTKYAASFTDVNHMQKANAKLEIQGLTAKQMQQALFAGNDENGMIGYLSHPEHYFVEGIEHGNHGMEVFGMYGEPINLLVHVDPHIDLPTDARDNKFPMAVASYTELANDHQKMNMRILSQLKPTEEGLVADMSVFFPPAVPATLVYGHSIHLAMEFSEMIKYAAKEL